LLLSGAPVLNRFGPGPGLVPFCQTFVRCCQATYYLCQPFFRHYLATAKKDCFHPPPPARRGIRFNKINAMVRDGTRWKKEWARPTAPIPGGGSGVCTGPNFKKRKKEKPDRKDFFLSNNDCEENEFHQSNTNPQIE